MNRADKKEWLGRYRRCVDEIKSLEILEVELYESATGLSSPVLDGMPRSPGFSAGQSGKVDKHLDVRADLEDLREKSNIIRREISGAINGLEDGNQARVLRYKYINGYEWAEIQRYMNYSPGGLFNLHSRALDNLAIGQTKE